MAALSRQGSDVRINEIDLSTTLAQNSNVTAAIVAVSSQGPIGPTLYSSFDNYKADFGNLNSLVSYDGYCAKDYFAEGNTLWAIRAVNIDSLYGCARVYVDNTGNTVIDQATMFDPTTFVTWGTTYPAGSTPLYLFYYKRGPGSSSSNIKLGLRSQNLAAPSGLATLSSSTGGTLSAGTYEYTVCAVGPNGDSLSATPVQIVVTSGTNTNTVTISWNPVQGATAYKVFGRLSTNLKYLTTVGAATTTLLDDGLYTVGSAAPFTNVSQLPPASVLFSLDVYDLTFDTQNPVETFDCSMTEQVDEMGLQMETAQRVNSFSQYIRCKSHIPAIVTLPRVYSAGPALLGTGTAGSAPTDANVNAAWNVFSDKQNYVLDVLINAGRGSVAVQQNMEQIVRTRFDSVAFLDVPSSSQTAQEAVDFRNLQLNLNSSFAALFCSDLLESDPDNGKTLYIPPSGAMAALMARTTRVGQPWFSMAGLNRGLVNALDVRNTYDDGDSTYLYQNQVNYMRKFVGQGIPLWEQSTLYAKASSLQFLNVRVLCNVIKRSMYNFLLYSLQEPGDDLLRKQIKYGLEDYLSYVEGARGITSSTVVVSAVNNPAILTNSGITAVAVYIVPILATRQINLSLLIGKQGLNVTEQDIANLTL